MQNVVKANSKVQEGTCSGVAEGLCHNLQLFLKTTHFPWDGQHSCSLKHLFWCVDLLKDSLFFSLLLFRGEQPENHEAALSVTLSHWGQGSHSWGPGRGPSRADLPVLYGRGTAFVTSSWRPVKHVNT